jgi:hypothetical protein
VECGARLEWPGTETERENGLYYAVLGSHPDVVRYLLGKGLDPNVTRVAITDFLIADSGCESNEARTHREMAKMLVSKGFTADKAVLRQRIAPQGLKSALESYLWKHSK